MRHRVQDDVDPDRISAAGEYFEVLAHVTLPLERIPEIGIVRHGGPLLRDIALFDIYRGQPLAETDKSLAYRLTLRDDDRTLTDADLDEAVAGVVAGLTVDLGARFRT